MTGIQQGCPTVSNFLLTSTCLHVNWWFVVHVKCDTNYAECACMLICFCVYTYNFLLYCLVFAYHSATCLSTFFWFFYFSLWEVFKEQINLIIWSLSALYSLWFSSPELVTWGAVWTSLRFQRKWIMPSWNVCRGGQRRGWMQSSSPCQAKTETSTDCSVSQVFLSIYLYIDKIVHFTDGTQLVKKDWMHPVGQKVAYSISPNNLI